MHTLWPYKFGHSAHTFTETLAKGCQIEGKGTCGPNEILARSQEFYEVPEVSPGLARSPCNP